MVTVQLLNLQSIFKPKLQYYHNYNFKLSSSSVLILIFGSLYQVFVLPVEGITVFDCSSPVDRGHSSKSRPTTEYVTALIHVSHIGTEMNFTVGDGLYYGSFFNAPLENGRNYYIILRAVSQWKRVWYSLLAQLQYERNCNTLDVKKYVCFFFFFFLRRI